MKDNITYIENNFNENNLFNNIIEYEEYFLIKDNNIYKIYILKLKNEIIIKCKDYQISLNINNLSILTKSIFNNIDDIYQFIINIFEQNKVKIKDIISYKSIKLILKINIDNMEKEIEIILYYNKENKYLNNNILINKEINNIKDEIKILKNKIDNSKVNISNLKENNNKNNIYNSNENEDNFSNLKKLNY